MFLDAENYKSLSQHFAFTHLQQFWIHLLVPRCTMLFILLKQLQLIIMTFTQDILPFFIHYVCELMDGKRVLQCHFYVCCAHYTHKSNDTLTLLYCAFIYCMYRCCPQAQRRNEKDMHIAYYICPNN